MEGSSFEPVTENNNIVNTVQHGGSFKITCFRGMNVGHVSNMIYIQTKVTTYYLSDVLR